MLPKWERNRAKLITPLDDNDDLTVVTYEYEDLLTKIYFIRTEGNKLITESITMTQSEATRLRDHLNQILAIPMLE